MHDWPQQAQRLALSQCKPHLSPWGWPAAADWGWLCQHCLRWGGHHRMSCPCWTPACLAILPGASLGGIGWDVALRQLQQQATSITLVQEKATRAVPTARDRPYVAKQPCLGAPCEQWLGLWL